MDQKSLIITGIFFILILLFFLCERAFSAEPVDREKAILEIVTPKEKRTGRLPYSSKRIKAFKDAAYRRKLVDAFEAAAKEFNLPANLLVAFSYRETVFRPQLEGSKGERGILQVMPRTMKLCKKYCKKIETVKGGVFCGSCWLAKGIKNCGTIEGGVSAYVSGRCIPYSKKVKMAVANRLWLWKHLDELMGVEQ